MGTTSRPIHCNYSFEIFKTHFAKVCIVYLTNGRAEEPCIISAGSQFWAIRASDSVSNGLRVGAGDTSLYCHVRCGDGRGTPTTSLSTTATPKLVSKLITMAPLGFKGRCNALEWCTLEVLEEMLSFSSVSLEAISFACTRACCEAVFIVLCCALTESYCCDRPRLKALVVVALSSSQSLSLLRWASIRCLPVVASDGPILDPNRKVDPISNF